MADSITGKVGLGSAPLEVSFGCRWWRVFRLSPSMCIMFAFDVIYNDGSGNLSWPNVHMNAWSGSSEFIQMGREGSYHRT